MRDPLHIGAALLILAITAPVAVADQLRSMTSSLVLASNSSAEPPAVKNEEKGENDSNKDEDDDEEYEDLNAEKAKPIDPHTAAMLALAKQSGCLSCHKIERKLVGPGWSDVAQRYKNAPEARAKLVEKVSRGGGGNWTAVTGGMRMPPYGEKVARTDIDTLVDFILSLPPQ